VSRVLSFFLLMPTLFFDRKQRELALLLNVVIIFFGGETIDYICPPRISLLSNGLAAKVAREASG